MNIGHLHNKQYMLIIVYRRSTCSGTTRKWINLHHRLSAANVVCGVLTRRENVTNFRRGEDKFYGLGQIFRELKMDGYCKLQQVFRCQVPNDMSMCDVASQSWSNEIRATVGHDSCTVTLSLIRISFVCAYRQTGQTLNYALYILRVENTRDIQNIPRGEDALEQ